MNYLQVINVVKYGIAAIGGFIFIFRLVRIAAFNRNSEDEPVPFRIFTYYNTFEVDGTDIPERRYFMRRMNNLMGFLILCIVLVVITLILPSILEKLGF